MIIYKITNTINGKTYIGQTIQPLQKRWNEHCVKSNGCKFIKNAIQKYGKENFTVETIDKASNMEELNQKEIYWIKHFKSTDKNIGYNLDSGGKKRKPTAEEIEKVRKYRVGKKHSPETIEKMRQRRLDRRPLNDQERLNHIYAKRKASLQELKTNDMKFISKGYNKYRVKVFNNRLGDFYTLEEAKNARNNYLKSIDNEVQSILNYKKGDI